MDLTKHITDLANLAARAKMATPVPAAPKPNQLKAGRNELCPCGSGLKFKRCCLQPKD